MAGSEKIGEIYVEIKARQDKMEADLKKLTAEAKKRARETENAFKNTRLTFDTYTGKMKLKELEAYHKKLEAQFKRKLELNVSARSLLDTKNKIAAVEGQLKSLGKSMGGLRSLSGIPGLGGISSIMGAGGTFAMTAAAVTALGIAIKKAVDSAVQYYDRINDLSKALGLNIETTQALDYLMLQEGKSADNLAGAISILYGNLDSAAQGSKEAARAFKDMGIQTIDSNGNMREGQEVFLDVLDSLKNETDETKRAINAKKLLGRSWLDVAEIMDVGRDGIKRAADELKNLGVQADADKIERYKKANAEFAMSIMGIKTAIVNSGLIDLLSKFIETMASLPSKVREVGGSPKDYFNALAVMFKKGDVSATGYANALFEVRGESILLVDAINKLTDAGENADAMLKKGGGTKKELTEDEINRAIRRQYEYNQLIADAALIGATMKIPELANLKDEDLANLREWVGLMEQSLRAEKETGKMAKSGWEVDRAKAADIDRFLKESFVGPEKPARWEEKEDFNAWAESMKSNIISTSAIASKAMDSFEEGFSAMWEKWTIFSQDSIEKTSNDFLRGLMTMANAFERAVLSMIAQIAALQAVMAIGNLISPGLGKSIGNLFGWKSHSGGEFVGTGSGVKKLAFAGGGDFMVPMGFNNDTFPLWVQSGERVSVTPAGGKSKDSALLEGILKATKAQTLTMAMMGTRVNKLEVSAGAMSGRDIQLVVEKENRISDRIR